MQDPSQHQASMPEYGGHGEPRPTRRRIGLGWLSLVIGGVAFLGVISCGGCGIWFVYLGTYAPETSVYAGNEVPNRFIETMKSVGALEEGETILYFYSDALTDIRDGFYFVSDRRVVVYAEAAGGSPLTTVGFDEIAELDIVRDESFFTDSQITLELKDGRPVSFPVSSEVGGDERFFEAIEERVAEEEESEEV